MAQDMEEEAQCSHLDKENISPKPGSKQEPQFLPFCPSPWLLLLADTDLKVHFFSIDATVKLLPAGSFQCMNWLWWDCQDLQRANNGKQHFSTNLL